MQKRGMKNYSMMEYILFDLDGTLTDPKIGITLSVQYALKHFGIEEPDLDKLEPFIGPPLRDSFIKFYGFTEEQAEEAVEKYRERFRDIGIFENKVYQGIPGLLKNLKAAGRKIAIASSKPTVFVERILKHFKLDRYFDVVVGSELDGSRGTKEEVVKEALDQLFAGKPVERAKVVMIGDRKFDIQGARAWFIPSIGVTYGYGSEAELKEAGADYVAGNVKQLEEILLGDEFKVRKEVPLRKIWLIALPFLTFLIIRQVSIYFGMYGLSALFPVQSQEDANLFFYMTSSGQVNLTDLGVNVLSAFSFVIAGILIWYLNRPILRKAELQAKRLHPRRESVFTYLFVVAASVGMSLGMNLLLFLTGITSLSVSYQEVSASQYSVSVPLGLFIYGLAAPLAEELIFRGVLYNRIKKMFNVPVGIVLTAVLFAAYHGNMVQGLFAFFMGLVIVYLYEEFGFFYIPVAVHAIMNLTSYLLTISSQYSEMLAHWYVCIPMLMIGLGSLAFLYFRNHTILIQFKNKR